MSKPEDKKSSPTIFLEIFSDKKSIYIKVNLNEIAESFFYNKKHIYVKANLNNIAKGFLLEFWKIIHKILLKISWKYFDDYSNCISRILKTPAGVRAEIWISSRGWPQRSLLEDTVKLIYVSWDITRCSTRCNLRCQCLLANIDIRSNMLWWVKSQQFIDSNKE